MANHLITGLVKPIKNKTKNITVLVLAIALGACSEQTQQLEQVSPKQATSSADKSTDPSAKNKKQLSTDQLTVNDSQQPTQVPTTNAERKALLDTLNIKANSSIADRRLALFVRYTYFADNPQHQLVTLEQLIEEIAAMRKTRADDHELTALYGSAISLQTIFFLDNLGKTNLLSKKGSRYLDRAVKSAPNHLGVRLYRGITYAEMPAFLGKARQAVTDFKLIKHAGNAFPGKKSTDQQDQQANNKFAAMIDYYYAMALIKNQQQDSGIRQLTLLTGKNIQPWSERAAVLKQEQG